MSNPHACPRGVMTLITQGGGESKPRYLVCAAWPYINYVPHLGTIIPLLSADVAARFLRMNGHEVLFVSGSDEHGTPIEVEAVRQGVEPRELTDKNHALVVRLFREWGLLSLIHI